MTEQGLAARVEALLVEAMSGAAVGRWLAAEDSLLSAAEEALRARFAVGGAPYVDVLRLRSERLRVQGDRARAATEARAACRALFALAGEATAEVDALIAAQTAAAGVLPPAPSVVRATSPCCRGRSSQSRVA